MRDLPANHLGTGRLAPDDEAWLRARGAVFAHVGPDGVIEFSQRPLQAALTDAVRDLMAPAAGSVLHGVLLK